MAPTREVTNDQDPDRILVEGLADRVRRQPEIFRDVADLAAAAGVGSSRLRQLLRRHYHVTPSEMLARRRVERASRELLAGDRPIAEIAEGAGFETLPAFEETFRRRRHMSPRSYRRLRRADAFEIELPSWFRRGRVLRYLGRDPQSPCERVRGTTFTCGTRAGGAPVRLDVELGGGVARCRVERPGAPPMGDASGVHAQVLRLLGLSIDPRPFERRAAHQEDVARLVGGRRGLSIPQTATVFDGLVWVIVGQQVSLAVAFSMRRRLTRRAGAPLGGGLHATPAPETVAALEEGDLRDLGFSGRKAEYLLAIARDVAAGRLDLDALRQLSATALERRLLAVRGLGPWSASYLRMRAFGLADCVPVGDAALTRNLARFFALDARPGPQRTRELMAPFAPHRSLATFHLWSLLEEAQ